MKTTTAPVSRGPEAASPPAVPQPRAGEEAAANAPTPAGGRPSHHLPAPHRIPPGTRVQARVFGELMEGHVLPHDTSTVGRLPLVPVQFGEFCCNLLPTDLSIMDTPGTAG